MNHVDTSPEKVGKEWEKIAADWQLNFDEPETVDGEPLPDEESGAEVILSDDDRRAKELITGNLIRSSLEMVLGIVGMSDLDENVKQDFANTWAVVIVKRFPDNPITDFMEEYGDLVSAGAATLVLFGAIKNKRKAPEREKVQQQTKQAMSDEVRDYEMEVETDGD
ncbi:MAG: hypothetical protein LC637_06100 [Xanthomonadaceae bacterium]|nr:hypothetical protein [Xanthomonadaceae bacterium]